MSKEVVIIGGGVIGLFSAYYLSRDGHQVTIIDKDDLTDGASFGNCGMIAPSHLVPIASPGMISKGLRWMLSPKSPFYIRPRLSGELFRWCSQFYRSATEDHVQQSISPFGEYLQLSKRLFQELATEPNEYFYDESGLLIIYQTEKAAESEIRDAEIGREFGLEVDLLNESDLNSLQPNIKMNARGGVHYKGDMSLHPAALMQYLKKKLNESGAKFVTNTEVQSMKKSGNKIKAIVTSTEEIKGDEFVLAAGAWSSVLAKSIGIRLSLLPAKGYSFNMAMRDNSPTISTILSEGKVAVTPMGKELRFGGTLEITKLTDHKINLKRIDGILNHIRSFYPDLQIDDPKEKDIWHGYRPCSPDGLPYLGRPSEFVNLIIGTGHGMLGLSLGPATGKIICSILNGNNPEVNIDLYHPNRKF